MSIENELALRVAWYAKNYGPIPKEEIIRLFRIGHGFGTSDADRELTELAQEILSYYR
jgi:hypothetical protein